MAQRKSKHSRRQALSRRRWKDLQDAKRGKYTGFWNRRDRRRAAFQTMKERFSIVQHYRRLCGSGRKKGQAACETGTAYGCSESTVRNYERLVRQAGKRGLMPEIRVRETPPRPPWEVIQIIVMLRRLLHWGGERIAAELDSREIYTISGQGVYNLFKRYRVYTRTYHPVGKRGGIAYTHLTATHPNETWHLDFAGPFITKAKQKCWVLVVVDAHSRFLLTLKVVESLETQGVLDHLSDLFAQYGKPEKVVTDNAPTFRSAWDNEHHRFRAWLDTHDIEHQRIPSYYPEANGKAEAMVKIAKREAITPCLNSQKTWTIAGLQRLLDRFQEYYNFDRLHGGISWKTPSECYTGIVERPHKLEKLFFVVEPVLEFQFC